MDATVSGYGPPTFAEATRTFARIGLLSFGGPAGQIALMHRILVEEKRWLDEQRFLHALNYCMLLPGPEAMQLATYAGWLLHGTRGGLAAGLLFVLPGAAVIVALSAAYMLAGHVPLVAGLLFGLKAAVLAVVAEATLKVARRTLKRWLSVGIAFAAFVAIFFLAVPFPLIVLGAAVFGAVVLRKPGPAGSAAQVPGRPSGAGTTFRTLGVWLAAWIVPLALLIWIAGRGHVLTQEALFFSKMAVVTFGGAYAVLAYVAQQAVEAYGWLRPDEMLTGLGLAETTPGPLILVLVFVGFLGGARLAGMEPLAGGLLGASVALWFTFVPCFLWVLVGAPYIERLRGVRWLDGALSAITAAVVGIIANLGVWFALHVVFATVGQRQIGPFRLPVPDVATIDWAACVIALAAGVALLVNRVPMLVVLAAAAIAGAVLRLAA
ncbi:MAG: chromate efflux transporter [Rhizobiaceae bacterium]|nr:chromate efflux transporter [Rhizobiaceae bacterium]